MNTVTFSSFADFAGSSKDKSKKPKKDAKGGKVKDPCQKYLTEAAAAAAAGAVIGTFTYGIGMVAGAVAAAALQKKAAECKKKEQIKAEQLAALEQKKIEDLAKKHEEELVKQQSAGVSPAQLLGLPVSPKSLSTSLFPERRASYLGLSHESISLIVLGGVVLFFYSTTNK